jgi:hypothetical protein
MIARHAASVRVINMAEYKSFCSGAELFSTLRHYSKPPMLARLLIGVQIQSLVHYSSAMSSR